MFDLNFSILIIFLLIWVLLGFLKKNFFGPIGAVIEQREQKIAGDRRRLDDMVKEIGSQTSHVESLLKDAQLEAATIRESWLKQGEAVKDKIVAQARQESALLFDRKMDDLDRQIVHAQEQLETEINGYCAKIKEIIL